MPDVRAKMEVFRLSWQLAWSIPQLLRDRDPNEHSSEIPAGFWTHSTLSLPLSGSSQKAKKLKSNKCRLSKNLVRFRGWNLAIGLMNKYWTGKHQLPRSCSLPAGIFGGCPSISKLSFSFGQTFFLRFSFDWKIFCLIAGTSGAHFRVFGDFSFSSQHN